MKLIFISIFALLLACSKDGSSSSPKSDQPGTNSVNSTLEGAWVTDCGVTNGGSSKDQWTFKGQTFTNSQLFFTDNNCQTAADSNEGWKGTFKIVGDGAVAGSKAIDLDATDMADSHTLMYNIFRIEGNTLTFGNYSDTAATRPTEFAVSWQFKKVP